MYCQRKRLCDDNVKCQKCSDRYIYSKGAKILLAANMVYSSTMLCFPVSATRSPSLTSTTVHIFQFPWTSFWIAPSVLTYFNPASSSNYLKFYRSIPSPVRCPHIKLHASLSSHAGSRVASGWIFPPGIPILKTTWKGKCNQTPSLDDFLLIFYWFALASHRKTWFPVWWKWWGWFVVKYILVHNIHYV